MDLLPVIAGFELRHRRYRAMVSLERTDAEAVAREAETRGVSVSEVIRERIHRSFTPDSPRKTP